MATSRWASSLANIETRIRRSLGIVGPISLTLDDPPKLLPVMIADDLTRPGCTVDWRGRRWALNHSSDAIAIGQRGLVYFVCSGLNTSLGALDKGGIVVDYIDLQWITTSPTFERILTAVHMAPMFATTPAAANRAGWMVDPIGQAGFPGTTEAAPVAAGMHITQPVTGFGERVWEGELHNGGTSVGHNHGPFRVPADFFLREQSFIAAGNVIPLVNSAYININVRGRVF